MSIDRTSPLNPVSTVQQRETNDHPTLQNRPGKSTSTNSTHVQISDAQAKLMQPSDSDINLARVEALKTAIRNGEVKMDTGKIADALLQEARNTLSGK
ncbi:flagellar biosynthesis anti-sigma factor FlgM [Citrobacter sp. JGM124]|uniref:flagellar biosynthesis anti-sigma factor FlgM n=1 Tax=Citrobacter sp. JGM124 TaxID=2799789 RepID=UPI001BA6E189|nr:flagellar biosynthesis anti-sigma factor FlgM [Citrobacter sp. JGM124]MBS0847654.1 anti-sigma-28 factor FlgM [Citrobacter sp. JGM124]